MSENSKIEWCDDSVSFWWGCTRFGDGCRHCYAEKLSKRYGDFWGPPAPRLWIKSAESECLRLNRKAEREGKPRVVFVNSMSDFFENHAGPVVSRAGNRMYMFEGGLKEASSPNAQVCLPPVTLHDLRRNAFEIFDECEWLRFLLLTKRPENVPDMWRQCARCKGNGRGGRRNVWIGTSLSTQKDAERNLDALRKCRDLAPVLFVSAEPLIERVEADLSDIDLCIVGGESGRDARPCDLDWIGSLIAQCRTAGTACFVKQLGARPVVDGRGMKFLDKKGGDIETWPIALRVREFPEVKHG